MSQRVANWSEVLELLDLIGVENQLFCDLIIPLIMLQAWDKVDIFLFDFNHFFYLQQVVWKSYWRSMFRPVWLLALELFKLEFILCLRILCLRFQARWPFNEHVIGLLQAAFFPWLFVNMAIHIHFNLYIKSFTFIEYSTSMFL